MNKKQIANILFFSSLLSFPVSFWISALVGEVDIFGVYGAVKYSWISWLFIPVSVACFIFGLYLKRNNLKYKKNVVVAFLVIPVLLIIGSYSFIGREGYNYSYNEEEINSVEVKIQFELPDGMESISVKEYNFMEIRAKINSSDKKAFEERIFSDSKWTDSLRTVIKNALPRSLDAEMTEFDYFLFYNETTCEYNVYPQSVGRYKCVFIAYDVNIGKFIILNNFYLEEGYD